MIKRNQHIINSFISILTIFVLINIANVYMNFYASVNDTFDFTIIDSLFIIKLIALLSLFIPLVIWSRRTDFDILKKQVIILSITVFVISILFYVTLYLIKFDILLNAMDILRNKMIEGNKSLLLEFSIETYNTLKFLKTSYQGLNSELILMTELLFLLWHTRNIFTLQTVDEDNIEYDDFMYSPNYRISSFVTINLLSYTFDLLGFLLFTFSLGAFVITILINHYMFRISRMVSFKSSKSHYNTFLNSTYILNIINILMYIAIIILNIYARMLEVGSYRIISANITLLLSLILFMRLTYVKTFQLK